MRREVIGGVAIVALAQPVAYIARRSVCGVWRVCDGGMVDSD